MLFRSRQVRPFLDGDFGSHGRYSATWGTILDRDPELRTVYVTVDLWLGDREFKVARAPVSFTSSVTSRVHAYLPALIEEPELRSAISLFQQTAQARTVTIQISSAALGQPTSQLTYGATLGGVAEVCLQVEATDYAARLIWMRGEITSVDVDPKNGGVLQVQIADFRTTQSASVPEHAVDTDRWFDAADSAIGQRYALIINGYPKVPGLMVDQPLAGGSPVAYLYAGRGPQPLQASVVYINGAVTAETYVDAEQADALGTLARTITFSTGTWEDNDALYADVTISSGRTLDPVELLQYLLATYTGYGRMGLNLDSFARARSRLRAVHPKVLINASGDEGVDVLSYVEGTYLKSLPMLQLHYAGAGLGVCTIDRRAGPGSLRMDAVVTGGRWPLMDRETDYTESPRDGRYNAFELRYNYDAMLGDYTSIVQRDASNSRLCALSQRFDGGRREADALDSPIIHSDALAGSVIGWQVAHLAVPYYTVTWSAYPSAAIRLQPGMKVLYTDPDRSEFTSASAIVLETSLQRGGDSSVTFAVWHPRWTQAMCGG